MDSDLALGLHDRPGLRHHQASIDPVITIVHPFVSCFQHHTRNEKELSRQMLPDESDLLLTRIWKYLPGASRGRPGPALGLHGRPWILAPSGEHP